MEILVIPERLSIMFSNYSGADKTKGPLDSGADLLDAPPLNSQQDELNDDSHLTSLPQLTNLVPENPTPAPLLSESAATSLDGEATMTIFPVNPRPFLISDLLIDQGWNHPARGWVALGGEPTREHEDFAIFSIDPMPIEDDQI